MLDFRILISAIAVAAVLMAAILFSFDNGDVTIATLPRPAVETAAAPRLQSVALPSREIVIPEPVLPPVRATAPVPAAREATGSIDPATGAANPAPPRSRARTAKQSEEVRLNPFQLFFQLRDDAKSK